MEEYLLMCRDEPVYSITRNVIVNKQLVPGCFLKGESEVAFSKWLQNRYASGSNLSARKLKSLAFGRVRNDEVNISTRLLSLSDCYWIKVSDENVKFVDVSPYYNDFWNGNGVYKGQAIPTLYLNGFQSKYWRGKNILCKYSARDDLSIEVLCSKLASDCLLDVVDIQQDSDGSILIKNMTTPFTMFESAQDSGKFTEDFLYSDIIEEFGSDGANMLIFDAIVGNGDRHWGNFGYLRNTYTGEYLGLMPLFDFDHAGDTKGTDDVLLRDIKELCNEYTEIKHRAKSLAYRIIQNTDVDWIQERAKIIMEV